MTSATNWEEEGGEEEEENVGLTLTGENWQKITYRQNLNMDKLIWKK